MNKYLMKSYKCRILLDRDSFNNHSEPLYNLQLKSYLKWKDADYFYKKFTVPTSLTNLENITKALEELRSDEINLIDLSPKERNNETIYFANSNNNFRILIYPQIFPYYQFKFLGPHILQISRSYKSSFTNWLVLVFLFLVLLYLIIFGTTRWDLVLYSLFLGITFIKGMISKSTWETVKPYNLSHGNYKDVLTFYKDFTNPPESMLKKSNICENCKYYKRRYKS